MAAPTLRRAGFYGETTVTKVGKDTASIEAFVGLSDVESLSPYERNARVHSDASIARLIKIIEQMGWTNPILIDETGIIAGHKRRLAAKKIYDGGGTIRLPSGAELPKGKVPTLDVTGWTEEQRRAYIIADNQTTMDSKWDGDTLRLELEWLNTSGSDMALTGFSGVDLVKALGTFGGTQGPSDGEETYSRKITAPIYEPKGDNPAPSELFDDAKSRELIAEIRDADLPEDVAEFLVAAAARHTRFNFRRISDFYAAAPVETQRLMESSALVIIDFGQAIESGFVKLTKRLGELASSSREVEEQDA